jgi:hypothetical protein
MKNNFNRLIKAGVFYDLAIRISSGILSYNLTLSSTENISLTFKDR